MSWVVSRAMPRRRLTWSRVGVTICVALIAFGAVTALVPLHAGSRPVATAVPSAMAGSRVANAPVQKLAAPLVAAQRTAAQQVAVRFVTACDTTGPTEPEGDVGTEAALAPELVVRHDVVWPSAWRTEDRATKVVLDPPGQPVAERGDTVAVIVTGTMTVTSDSGPSQLVPLAERITLHPAPAGHSAGDRGATGWQVVAIEVGA
ncbi:MAG TPA: hypothetical protein VMR97_04975 [Acidimicrobiales bacterium]|nr:hypothetical protein [Acidimicrobiales bacterium]